MNSFTAKRLRVTMILAESNAVFPGTNSNTLALENMRMSAKVQAVARLSTHADISIYGMKQADMNAMSVIWAQPPVVLNHLVILEANSTGRDDGWTQVFKGTIIEAQPDYRAAPDVAFTLLARTAYNIQITPVASTSYPFQVDIGAVASDIVARMGPPWTFTNGGADGVLSNPYFYGTLWDQLAQACAAAHADFYAQGDEILIVPAGRPRPSLPVVILTPESGLMGYPMFERSGLNVNALFSPAFLCGTPLEIQSDIPQAVGRWFPYSLFHILESRTPRGSWMTQLQCLRVVV